MVSGMLKTMQHKPSSEKGQGLKPDWRDLAAMILATYAVLIVPIAILLVSIALTIMLAVHLAS